jgi:hypothetical protein
MSDKPQRWKRIFVELPVIIVGVLIALGVDQWRSSQEDRRLEADYLVRLEADLTETREAVLSTIEDFAELVAHGSAVAHVLNEDTPFPDDSLGFLASALQVSRGNYDPAVSRGAYDDLISTGNLRVLENEELRYELSSFYGSIDHLLSPVDYSADKIPYRFTIRGLLSLETQLLIRANCDGAEPLLCPDYEGPGGYRAVVEAIIKSPNIRPELTVTLQGMAIRSLTGGVTGGFAPVLERIDSLLGMVRTSTG